MFGEEELVKSHSKRAQMLGNLILVAFLIVLFRLWYLQIHKGKIFLKYSLENRLRKEALKAPRGMIFSRNNELLVNNVPRFDAAIIPQYFKDKDKTFARLSRILKMPVSSIEKRYTKGDRQERFIPIVIKKNISMEEVAKIETESSELPGVSTRTFIARDYKDDDVGAHLLGYISEISKTELPKYRKRDKYNYKKGDFIGKDGIEEQFDLLLRGVDGHEFKEVDALGRMKRHLKDDHIFKGIKNKEAIPGHNLRLTIDRDLQLVAYKALEGKEGSAVAIDVNTGEVLAMVSRPSYRPSEFSRGVSSDVWSELIANERRPLRDRTVQEHYPPGSTFKVFTAIAALEEGIIDETTECNCKGSFRVGRRVFHDWKKSGFGKTDVYKSIKQSVDVFYYKIATKLDIDVLASYTREFGFGARAGVTLPREETGLVPTKDWKLKLNGVPWQVGETVGSVIGQSYVLVTPLQLANAYAAIANEGTLYKPYLVREIFDNNGKVIKRMAPEVINNITNVSKKTFRIIKSGLYKVVNEPGGTAWFFRGQGIEMAGKTGTSQVIQMTKEELFQKCEEMVYKHRHHGVFAAFAPFYDPRIAVAVVVEHGCHGSTAAAPVARDIITEFMKKYYPKEYEDNIKKQKKRDKLSLDKVQKVKEVSVTKETKVEMDDHAEGDDSKVNQGSHDQEPIAFPGE